MASVDLTKAKEVRVASNAHSANKLLAQGWVLIDTGSGMDQSNYPLNTFTLAWFRDDAPLSEHLS